MFYEMLKIKSLICRENSQCGSKRSETSVQTQFFFLCKVILGKNLSRLVEARFSSAHPHEPDTSLWVRGSSLIRRVWHGIHQFGSCKCNAFPFRKLKKIQSYQMKGSRHIFILSWFCFANALWLISPVRFASCSPTNQMQRNTRLGHIRFP